MDERDSPPDKPKGRRVGREIALSLGFAAVFGTLLGIYLLRSMPSREELGAHLIADAAAAPAGPSNLDVAERIANAFVGHVGAGRMPAAYAMMARSYRQTTSLATFARVWTSSPLLAQVSSVRIASANVGSVMTAAGERRAVATSSARGQLVAGASILDAAFTFIDEEGERRILALFVGGVAVLQGVANRPAVP